MIKIVDDCVGCTSMGLPCKGLSCRNRSHEIQCCDKCESEEALYHFEGGEYCFECFLDMGGVLEDDEDDEGDEDD